MTLHLHMEAHLIFPLADINHVHLHMAVTVMTVGDIRKYCENSCFISNIQHSRYSFHVCILNITIYLIVYIAQSKCIRKESRVIAAVHAIAAVTLQLPILQLSNNSPSHCVS